jgi:hypothetical protein
LKGVVTVAKTEFWEGKYKVVHDSSLRVYTIYLGEEEIGDRWTYEEAKRAIHHHADNNPTVGANCVRREWNPLTKLYRVYVDNLPIVGEFTYGETEELIGMYGKKEEKDMSKAKEMNERVTYYMDWDEIDADTEDVKMIYYVMQEKKGGRRKDDVAVYHSYCYADAFAEFQKRQKAAGYEKDAFSISVVKVKRDGKEESVYRVTGPNLTAEFPHDAEGFVRAGNLCDTLNKNEKEGDTGKFSVAVNDLDNLSESDYSTIGYTHYSSYNAPKPKPVKEDTLRNLRSYMEKIGDSADPYGCLFAYCALAESDLTEHLLTKCGFVDISSHSLIEAQLGTGDLIWKKGKESARKDVKRVLAVAHRDTVVKSDKHRQYVSHWENCKNPDDRLNDVLISSCFDDRIGIFTILHMLPKLGVDVDILFTTDEEIGASSAEYFSAEIARELTGYKGEGSPYSHIVEFDRRGEDVVAYSYEDKSASWKELEKEMKEIGMVIGQGSFTDICYLTHLETKAINVGMGTIDEHAKKSYLEIRPYLSNLLRYAKLYHRIKGSELSFPHEDAGGKRKTTTTYYGDSAVSKWSKEDWDKWDKQKAEGLDKRRKERQDAWLCESNDPNCNQVILTELPMKYFSLPVGSCTNGLTYEKSLSLYRDAKTGDEYLYDAKENRLYIIEDGEIQRDKGGK